MMGKKNSLLVFAVKLPSKAEEIFAKWNKYLKNPEKHNSELPGNIYHWFLLKFGYLGTLAHICPLVLPMEKAMSPHSSTLAWSTHPTPSHGWRSLVGCSPWGRWVRHDWATSLSCIGEWNGNPLECSCLENPREGGAWWVTVYGVAQSQTRLRRLSSSSGSSSVTQNNEENCCTWFSEFNFESSHSTRIKHQTLIYFLFQQQHKPITPR